MTKPHPTRRRLLHALTLAILSPLFALSHQARASLRAHHLSDGGFRNNYIDAINKPFSDLLKWRHNAPQHPLLTFPIATNDPTFLRANRQQPTITWIGHATLLLQLGGLNILTDPHFSSRASPVPFAGPKRGTPPGLAINELPAIDVILISHNHYDHLDYSSVKQLLHRRADTKFFAPLGVGQWLRQQGAKQVVELDWHDNATVGDVQFTAAPCQHWSSRLPWDRNRTLWASWIIAAQNFRFLFIGDTGYSPDFADLGKQYGGFDWAAIPIGAYEPRWFMKQAHINPDEAVQIFRDLRTRAAVATHWGTFQLTDEPMDEPPQKLRLALNAAGIAADNFAVLQHGETRTLSIGK